MLDRMIESQNNSSEKFRRGNFLLSTLFLVAITLSGALVYSLYAKPLGEMGENLELSSVVAPIAATEPAAVELPKSEIKATANSKPQTETVRIVNQQSIDESPKIPDGFSVVKNKYESRPAGRFRIGNINSTATDAPSGSSRESADTGIGVKQTPKVIDDEEATNEPPKMPKAEVKPPQQPKIQSLGVVNGMARNLPVPPYPAPARAVHASGAVNVQIMIDEAGRVVSAKAVSGHPLLRQAAEQAARSASFSPTLLSKIPVKATGVIVYNFVAQ